MRKPLRIGMPIADHLQFCCGKGRSCAHWSAARSFVISCDIAYVPESAAAAKSIRTSSPTFSTRR
jgi:hypothetical protein